MSTAILIRPSIGCPNNEGQSNTCLRGIWMTPQFFAVWSLVDHVKSLRPSIFAVILTCMIAAQRVLAAEAGLVSAYSDISHPKCAASGEATGDDTPVTYRCKLLDDLVLIAAYEGAAVRVSILRNGDDTGLRLGAGYDVGETLEWRGWRRDLKFEPAAAILRLIEKTSHNSYASVLTVLRVEREKICPAAWLDVAATPYANAVARQIADDAAGKFRCGTDAARVIGNVTELVQETIARAK